MRVLFLIPKAKSPVLDGPFSSAFKDFVGLCLIKDPRERPSAKELLKHRFIRGARNTIHLLDLIEKHAQWKAKGPPKLQQQPHETMTFNSDHLSSEWNFDTIRSQATIKKRGSMSPTTLTKAIPLGGTLTSRDLVAHRQDDRSASLISSRAPTTLKIENISSTISSTSADDENTIKPTISQLHPALPSLPEHSTAAVEASPAPSITISKQSSNSTYKQRSTSSRRSSLYNSGSNPNGIPINEDSLGDGHDTIRRIRKVDQHASINNSLIASLKAHATPHTSIETAPAKVEPTSEEGQIGRKLADDIFVPVLQNVSTLYRDDIAYSFLAARARADGQRT